MEREERRKKNIEEREKLGSMATIDFKKYDEEDKQRRNLAYK